MNLHATAKQLFTTSNLVGDYLGALALRLLLAVEFGASGLEKLHGENWFADIQDQFPFPFNLLPVNISWFIATWFELIGALALVLGFGVRFFSISLSVLTVVAIAAVHWPSEIVHLSDLAKGYVISDEGYGNFKLPLMYLLMFVPLILSGGGKASIDAVLLRLYQNRIMKS